MARMLFKQLDPLKLNQHKFKNDIKLLSKTVMVKKEVHFILIILNRLWKNNSSYCCEISKDKNNKKIMYREAAEWLKGYGTDTLDKFHK